MEGYFWILLIIGIAIIWGIVSWIIRTISNSKKYLELKPKLDNLENSIARHRAEVEEDKEEMEIRVEKWNEKVKNDKQEIQKIAKQKSMGFPWLAEAYADYFALKDGEIEKYLKHKKHPAPAAAENVKTIKNEKRKLVSAWPKSRKRLISIS